MTPTKLTAETRSIYGAPVAQVLPPVGWRIIGFREVGMMEFFLTADSRVGLQDGWVNFSGSDKRRLIVEKL